MSNVARIMMVALVPVTYLAGPVTFGAVRYVTYGFISSLVVCAGVLVLTGHARKTR